MELAVEVYALCRLLPKGEEYRIVGQLTRAGVSIPANIAEGHARASRRDYAHFVAIAQGSLAEVETYLILVQQLAFVNAAQTAHAEQLCGEVRRMLHALHAKLAQG